MIDLISIIAMFLMLTWGRVLPHELAHFVVAEFVFRLPVIKVKIGYGREIVSFCWRGVRFSFGSNPRSGGVEWLQWTNRPKRPLAYAATYAAGPLTDLALFAMLWPFTPLCVVFFFDVVWNLYPRRLSHERATDGFHIRSLVLRGRFE